MEMLALPHYRAIRDLSAKIGDLQSDLIAKGNISGAVGLARTAEIISKQLQNEGMSVHEFFGGLNIEKRFLENLPPGTYLPSGRTAAEQLAVVNAKTEEGLHLVRSVGVLDPNLASDQEIIHYARQIKAYGELGAIRELTKTSSPKFPLPEFGKPKP